MSLTNNLNIDDTQKQKLAVLLEEMKSRGLTLPQDAFASEKLNWNLDNDGWFISRDGKFFKPNSEDQLNFIRSRARFIGLFAGRGSGKSAGGAQKSLYKIMRGQPGAVMNPDFENFTISTWVEFKKWIPWDVVVRSQKHRQNDDWIPNKPFTMVFKNGARVICKGLKDPESARGPNINWLWYDEGARDKTGLGWQIANASVRVGENPQSWVTTTPKGRSTSWIHKFFIRKEIPQDALDEYQKIALPDVELVESFFSTIFDNQNNLDPGFFASMLATYPGGFLRQQELYGKFIDEGGELGDRSWFLGHYLNGRPEDVDVRVRYWDLAATEKKISGKKKNDPDETVGTLMSYKKHPRKFTIEDQIGGHWLWDAIKDNIVSTALLDGIAVKVRVEEEPGSGGKNQVAEINTTLQSRIPGHPGCEGYRPEGDRVNLSGIWFAEARQGLIDIVTGYWNEGFLSQLDGFPEDAHDDKVTSVSGARITIAPIRSWKKIDFMKL